MESGYSALRAVAFSMRCKMYDHLIDQIPCVILLTTYILAKHKMHVADGERKTLTLVPLEFLPFVSVLQANVSVTEQKK